MVQDIITWIIIAIAVLFFIRLIYVKFSNKDNVCDNCHNCTQKDCTDKSCSDCSCRVSSQCTCKGNCDNCRK